MLDLPAEPAPRIAHHADREAAFTVDEADDPLLDTWSFLLIVRTGRIVTDHATSIPEGCDTAEYQPDTRVFQHIANCTRHLAMAVGNLCCTQRKP